jgi:very-short-patch-repair endonuclease
MFDGDQALQLEQLRKRLLDLTLRNRLLNYPHPKGRSLRFVDTDPDWLVGELLAGNSLRIEHVPAPPRGEALERAWPEWVSENRPDARPGVREWAAFKGYDTGYDLRKLYGRGPQRGHSGRVRSVQALQYPEALEAQLNKIAQIARTAIEDSGANILYLAVGFLSWSEKEDASKVIAPLFLVPVALDSNGYDKETRRKIYNLRHNGEDLQENLSLREKLKRDFHLDLPPLEEEETVSSYLKKCERLTTGKPDWAIHHYATLGFFQFGKLLLYLDLDPKKWPEGAGPLSHPVISKVLGADDGDPGGFEYAEPLSPDELDVENPEFKLVQSADSSQHSVVVDAANGKNLVVEGPPGTGKSQTITNIIAVALMKGQSVLFVSEKMAALDVVRRRLDSVGLGDFCLELHSHRTQRKKLLEDIEKRVRRRRGGFPDGELQSAIRRFKRLRKKLNRYATLINSDVPGFRCTVHSLFWEVTHLRNAGVANADISDSCTGHTDLSADQLEEAQYKLGVALRRRREITADVGDFSDHPLFGLAIDRATVPSWDEARASLRLIEGAFRRLLSAAEATDKLTHARVEMTLEGISSLAALSEALQDPTNTERTVRLQALVTASASLVEFSEFVERETDYSGKHLQAQEAWVPDVLDEPAALASTIGQIGKLGAGRIPAVGMSVDELWRVAEAARALVNLFDAGAQDFRAFVDALGFDFPPGARGLFAADELFSILRSAPLDALELRDPVLEVVDDDVMFARMEREQTSLKESATRISLRFDIDRAKEVDAIRYAAGILSRKSLISGRFDADWRASNGLYRGLCISSPWLRSAKKRSADLDSIADHLGALSEFEKNISYAGLLGPRFKGLATPVPAYRSLATWNAEVRAWASKWFDNSLHIARAVMRLELSQLERVRSLDGAGLQKTVQQAIWNLKRLQELCGERLDDGWFGNWAEGASAAKEVADNIESALPSISERLRSSGIVLDDAVGKAKPLLKLALDKGRSTARSKFLNTVRGRGPLHDSDLARLREGRKFATIYWTNKACRDSHAVVDSAVDSEELAPLLASLKAIALAHDAFRQSAEKQLHRLGARDWFLGERLAEVPFEDAIARCNRALEGEPRFEQWCQLVASMKADEAAVVWDRLSDGVLSGSLSDDEAEATLRLGVLEQVLNRLISEYPELREFEGVEHEEVRTRLREVDDALLQLHREEAAYKAGSTRPPKGSSGSRVSDLTEMTLLKHEFRKQRGHLPIRKLVNRASGALRALKPCFMMGPLSVAQYLEPGKVQFDILIMDEASQMKPEDALGAIARARQVIVVGDPKQLPPTSFFDRIDDGVDDDIDDAFTIQGKGSILELLMPVLGQVRQLNWHYRSRHESLIAFCNRQFYDDRLLAFPSPRRQAVRGSLGITYHYVQGEYRQQRNQAEADELLRGVLKEIRASRGNRTVGVVAINSQQAELLNENWLRLLREHPDVEDLLTELPDSEPFFIKNLENVQGDERDVIFISLTYGPDEKGHFYQRFGPINQENGWRRLNVLFSRARENMVIYSSMRSDLVTPTSGNLGATALKQFLDYCERGGRFEAIATATSRPPDSPFELEVINELRRRGFACVPQVGVAGFFIDIGVIDPDSEGDFLLGIECDGATYHSAKSARDRDYLRQSILEGLGWKIHRIWSPDWFKRRDIEITRLVRSIELELERARARRQEQEQARKRTIHVGIIAEPISESATPPLQAEPGEPQAGAAEPQRAVEKAEATRSSREGLREALIRLRETIESEFPTVPAKQQLLRDELIAFFVEHMPTGRDEFASVVPVFVRQNIDVEQARRYLGTIFSLCEQYV